MGKAVFYIVHNNDSIALIDFPYRSQDRYAKLGSKKQEPPLGQVTVLSIELITAKGQPLVAAPFSILIIPVPAPAVKPWRTLTSGFHPAFPAQILSQTAQKPPNIPLLLAFFRRFAIMGLLL